MTPCRSPASTSEFSRGRGAPRRTGTAGRPAAIFEGKPPLEQIVAVNENASRLGIAPGMTKAQAELCSELALRPRSALQESSAHAALLDCAQSFSPCVEDSAYDTVFLDLAGMESLLGSLHKISCAISERAAALGLQANIATASNPDAALLAARGYGCVARALLPAYGVAVIPPGKEADILGRIAGRSFIFQSSGGEQKKKPTACSKRLPDGAFATCAPWPHCPKYRSANVSDKKASACSN